MNLPLFLLASFCTLCGVSGDELDIPAPFSLFRQAPTFIGTAGRKDAQELLLLPPIEREGGRLSITEAARRDAIEASLTITEDTLNKIQNVVVLEKEGVVYCPVPKVASTEWKRSLRWMAGIKDWKGNHSPVLPIVKNGLERLADRGVEETRRVFQSDRYLRFVVVREPAERLLSGFLNKCVTDGYMSGALNSAGAPSCRYLEIMPELFPNTKKASLRSHKRLKALVEGAPEDTFYHFVSGIWREMKQSGGPCMIKNHHFRPHTCFCDMYNLLPAFYVIPFSNMSAEAEALANRLPEAVPVSYKLQTGEGELVGAASMMQAERASKMQAEGASKMHAGRGTGVDRARRQEIREFLTARFKTSQDNEVKVTHAAQRKSTFLSERVQEVIHKIFETDFDLLGHYFNDG